MDGGNTAKITIKLVFICFNATIHTIGSGINGTAASGGIGFGAGGCSGGFYIN